MIILFDCLTDSLSICEVCFNGFHISCHNRPVVEPPRKCPKCHSGKDLRTIGALTVPSGMCVSYTSSEIKGKSACNNVRLSINACYSSRQDTRERKTTGQEQDAVCRADSTPRPPLAPNHFDQKSTERPGGTWTIKTFYSRQNWRFVDIYYGYEIVCRSTRGKVVGSILLRVRKCVKLVVLRVLEN